MFKYPLSFEFGLCVFRGGVQRSFRSSSITRSLGRSPSFEFGLCLFRGAVQRSFLSSSITRSLGRSQSFEFRLCLCLRMNVSNGHRKRLAPQIVSENDDETVLA